MPTPRNTLRNFVWFILLGSVLVSATGCGLVANLLNVVGAGLMPPAYPGLESKKVAVVCVSNSELFGPTATSEEVSTRVGRLLAQKVKEIQVVPNQKVNDWIDVNGWDMVDFVSIGRGVEADMVVAIDVNSLRLKDGPTMFKGRADVNIVVYDTFSGNEVFSKMPPEIEFPVTAGVPSTSVSEREFRKLFLNNLSNRIARHFYAFDINEDVASDVTTLSRL